MTSEDYTKSEDLFEVESIGEVIILHTPGRTPGRMSQPPETSSSTQTPTPKGYNTSSEPSGSNPEQLEAPLRRSGRVQRFSRVHRE